MAISSGLGKMLGTGAEEGAAQYLPYVGRAYTAYKAIKGFKDGGIKGAFRSVIPFGGSMFGGKGSRTNPIARQYMNLVNRFDKEFLKPTIENLGTAKRNIPRGSIRIGGESFRNILNQFEGAGARLREMVGSGDFGSITKHISNLADLSKRLQKEGGGRGAGPDIRTSPASGIQNIPIPKISPLDIQSKVLNLPNSIHLGGFSPIQSESHRFPVKTQQTPGEDMRIRKKSRLGYTPGILT